MRRAALVVGLVCIGMTAASCGGTDRAGCTRFCLTVEPPAGDTKTIFTIGGRRWIPDSHVVAHYGPYCPPRRACAAVIFGKTIRTDARGGFSLQFRSTPSGLHGHEGRSAVGGGPIRFEQRYGRPGHKTVVRRTARITVDGVRY